MMSESVIFEIQVDKKVLEQVFIENKHLKESYEKLIAAEDAIKPLQEEIVTLKKEIQKQQEVNLLLSEENLKIKTTTRKLERESRISEEKEKSDELTHNENKLLKMRLQKSESEKNNLIDKFEEEKKMLEELLKDNSNLLIKEQLLEETRKQLEKVTEELKKSTELISKVEEKNRQLDHDKFLLERKLEGITRKLRLEEQRNKSSDLEHVESKLLKLKLQNTEKENKYLIEEFDRERKIIMKQNQPRVAKLEENLRHLRKWIEKEARERRPRDTEEVKFLKEQIHSLEKTKIDLMEGFELERKVFQKILKANGNDNSACLEIK